MSELCDLFMHKPSKRVLPCIAALQDGAMPIVNGALQGSAGFALASDPSMNAVHSTPFNRKVNVSLF